MVCVPVHECQVGMGAGLHTTQLVLSYPPALLCLLWSAQALEGRMEPPPTHHYRY